MQEIMSNLAKSLQSCQKKKPRLFSIAKSAFIPLFKNIYSAAMALNVFRREFFLSIMLQMAREACRRLESVCTKLQGRIFNLQKHGGAANKHMYIQITERRVEWKCFLFFPSSEIAQEPLDSGGGLVLDVANLRQMLQRD